ncbi:MULTISPECIES: DoxX family protein [Variovorax]|jgi:putative oxidoreductase|uniref:DoxX family protein n=1 Tax=Variovorax TaxID=34072 RepID=UPI0008687F8F|nr:MULTISPECIES: DoxX family protein [Variovorax]MBN8758404.1 DoxX family protein [Variovorax sp.]ODU12535.1 MAG: DoxX family protein [Variovorax sp. SCN 67-85]ODV18083.1 MAG: DoxX family protein [Variovorax sp. SCN 67-20]OJZ05968.1 MAG: DoxX family protein [Variovorax sp. 67-131]UKI08848.1 DoxX family protein [Variovorax paradoxus]
MTSSSLASPTQRRIVWGVRILLAVAFGAAGTSKLAGVPQMVQVFDAIGFGQWFRYLTGLVEIGGALLLLVPATGFLGGLLLAATMVCAVATHLVLIGGNPAPAVVLALLSGFVAWRLRPVSRLATA